MASAGFPQNTSTTSALKLALFLAATLFCSMGSASAQATVPATEGASSEALLLDAGDLIDLHVFDTPELSSKLRVDELGQISLPVGGNVVVKGLTAEQAQSEIEQRFKKERILRNPHVEVLVLEYATQGVTITGEVKSPGVYPWVIKHTVADFIAVAGGFTLSASRTVTVNRRNREQIMTFPLVNTGQTPSGADMLVQPGDRIHVKRAGLVYVVGDVGRPGGYLVDGTETVTVLEVLALAQGVNKTAKSDAKLIRSTQSGRTESELSLKKILSNQVPDPKLQDGDILFVPVSGGKQFSEKGVSAILQMVVGLAIWQ